MGVNIDHCQYSYKISKYGSGVNNSHMGEYETEILIVEKFFYEEEIEPLNEKYVCVWQ